MEINLNPLGTFQGSYEKNFYNDYKLIFKNGFGGTTLVLFAITVRSQY